MWTLQLRRPVVDQLRLYYFVLFWLDDGQPAAGGNLVRGLDALCGRGGENYLCCRLVLLLQSAREAGGNKAAKGKAKQVYRQAWMLRAQPLQRGLGVIDFAAVQIMAAAAFTGAAKVETQGRQTMVTGGALHGGNHLVEHAAALTGVGVADQRDAAGVGGCQIHGFQFSGRAG